MIEHEALPTTRTPVMQLPGEDGRAVTRRRDCAVGFVMDDYSMSDNARPRISYIARAKPKTHHSKAGNVNNALYNCDLMGQYVVILDNDMEPHPKFLQATLPNFFELQENLGNDTCAS